MIILNDDVKKMWLKCHLGQVSFQVNAVSGRSPPQVYMICGVNLGAFAYLVMLVFRAYHCRSSVAQALKRLFADSGTQPLPPHFGSVC